MYLCSGYIGNYGNHIMIDYDTAENYKNNKVCSMNKVTFVKHPTICALTDKT